MDHYQTLGVAKSATPDEIKKAYRKLASQNHPDKGGDTNTFQKIQVAYDTLSDPNKRHQYDNPVNNQHFGFNFNTEGPNMEEILRHFGMHDIFKQNRQQVLRTRMDISLKESYFGTTKILNVQTQTGTHTVNLNVPKGINSNQQLRYENLIPNCVLIVDFNILPDLKFERRNNDLYSNEQISVLDLITGTKLKFQTFSGTFVELELKPLTQPYMQLKLAGCGMPILNSNGYGDQIILIKPFIPDNIKVEIIDAITKYK